MALDVRLLHACLQPFVFIPPEGITHEVAFEIGGPTQGHDCRRVVGNSDSYLKPGHSKIGVLSELGLLLSIGTDVASHVHHWVP